ncbi:MAG: hypothetical protein WAN36_09545 [Calditrichia bacterium]
MKNLFQVLLAAFLCSLLLSCSNEAPGKMDPRFGEIQEVLDKSCVRSECHYGVDVESRLDLREGHAYENLVSQQSGQVEDMLLIDPGSAENSYLVRKLEGGKIVGDQMPLGRKPLGADTILAIRKWINDGAENN